MQKRKLAHSTIVYMILGFIPMASSLFLTPVYTHYLTLEAYGLIAIANIIQTYLSLWVCFSLDAAFSRFYFNHHLDKAKITHMLSNTLLIILIITGITALVLALIGDFLIAKVFGADVFLYNDLGWQILVTSGFGMCYSVIALYYRDSENLKMFSILAILYFLLLTGCTYYGVVVMANGVKGSITGKMIGTLILMIPVLANIFYRYGLKFNFLFTRSMLKFSYPLFIYGILATIFDTMDRFFINHYFDLSVLGKYNFAFIIASVIGIVIASYQSAVNPSIYKMFLDRGTDNSLPLNVLMKKFIWTSLIFASLCVIFAYFVILFFINKEYHNSIFLIPLLSLTFIPRAYYMAWSYPLFIENKTKVLPLINGISIIAGIIMNIILIPLIGIYGVAVAVIIIKSVQAAGVFLVVKKLKIYSPKIYHFNSVNAASIVFIFLIVGITFTPYSSVFYRFLIFIPFITIMLLFLIYDNSLVKKGK